MAEVHELARVEAFPRFQRSDESVRAFEIFNSGIATVGARKGMRDQLLAQMSARLGADLPDGLGCVSKHGLTIISTAPDTWLCLKDEGGDLWASQFAAALRGLGSVADQTGGYVRVRLEGPQARAVLQKGAYLDLHPHSFGPGDAAQTSIAHVNVTLWRPGEGFDYELAIPRSYIRAFRHWLEVAGSV